MSINEIKDELDHILETPDESFVIKRMLLSDFCSRYGGDERSGVIRLIKRADNEIKALGSEISRLEAMRRYEDRYPEAEYICGVDEVGRGPLAGPIVAGAVILPKDVIIPYINDSKKLSPSKREELSRVIMDKAVSYAVGSRSAAFIDEHGIQKANFEAMEEAVSRLSITPDIVFVDAVHLPDLPVKQISIIKGDQNSISIAAASIIAKVTRDRLMDAYSPLYPDYDFGSNAGYGTAKHIDAIKHIGPTELHRKTFIKNFI